MEKDFQFFKKLLLEHSVERPPLSVKLFNMQETMKITEYAVNTYAGVDMKLDFVIENFMPAAKEPEIVSDLPILEATTTISVMDHIPEPLATKTASSPDISFPKEKVSFTVNVIGPNQLSDNLKNAAPVENTKVVPAALPTAPEPPVKSAKHENAISELKTYITTVLQSKLDEITHTVTQKISEQEHITKKNQAEELEKKRGAPVAKGKK